MDRIDEFLDRHRFPTEGVTEYIVIHSHSTGSSMDGTRQHSWRVQELTHHVRWDTKIYASLDEALADCDRRNKNNIEP
jgi:hypothetical protein